MVRQAERLFTLKEAAQVAGVEPVTVRMWVGKGWLPAQMFGATYVVKPSELRAYLKNRRPVGRPPNKAGK